MKIKHIVHLLAVLVIVLGLVGCNTQQKKDAEDAERLAIIEEKIDDLFNEEKTDIIANLNQEKINDIEELLGQEKDNKFSQDNLKRIDSILMYLDLAIDMVAMELEVDQLFDEAGGVLVGSETNDVEANLMLYETETVFYDRQLAKLTDANEQLLAIEEVREQIETLFVDGEVKPDVSREQEAKMRELIATLKSADGKRNLEAALVHVATLLSDQERAVVSAQRERTEALERQRETEVKAAKEKKQAPVKKVEKPVEPVSEPQPEQEQEESEITVDTPDEGESDLANPVEKKDEEDETDEEEKNEEPTNEA